MSLPTRYSFDTETAALPESEIAHLAPVFTAPANYKDPEKITAYCAEQRRKWIENAALSPITGRVLAIGLKPQGNDPFFLEAPRPDDEAAMLKEFWKLISTGSEFMRLFGWNIEGFDIPFLVKRSWRHRLDVPMHVVLNGRYLGSRWCDLMQRFQVVSRGGDFTSLDTAAQFLGVGKKNGDGAQFAATYAQDRNAALAYLRNDLELVEGVADVLAPCVVDVLLRDVA